MLLPTDLERFIAQHGIAAQLVIPPIDTPTVPAAAQALGVEPRQIIKSLLFLVREQPVLVIASGTALIDRRVLGERYGAGKKQIKLAAPETVARLTGYPVGGVPPFGHASPLPTLLDDSLFRWSVVYGGGGDERTLLSISPAELARVTRGEPIKLDE